VQDKKKKKIVLYPGMAGITRDYIEDLKAEGVKLLSVDIMLTQKCNFRCIYCYAEGGPERTNQLTMAEAKKIVDDAVDLKVKAVNLQGGEPLIWKPSDWTGEGDAIFSLIEYIQKKFSEHDLTVNILSFTDVAVMTKERAEKMAHYGVSLCCKLDSLDGDIQDTLLGVKGGAKRMMEGYKYLIEAGYGKSDMPPLSTNTVVTMLNYDGVKDVFRWSRKNHFNPFVIPVHVHGTAKKHSAIMLSGKSNNGTLSAGDIKKLFETLAEIDGKEFGIHWKALSPWVENKACSRHLGGIHVRADGVVVPCSEAPDFWALGHIRKNSLKEIVASEKVQKFRNIYSQLHENSKCSAKNCEMSREKKCYGCRTRAYDDSGFDEKGNFDPARMDPEAFFAGDPACWRSVKK